MANEAKRKEIDEWWEEFNATDNIEEKAGLVKKACALKREKAYYKAMEIGSALQDVIFQAWLDEKNHEKYCSLLEHMMLSCPNAFADEAHWHIYDYIYWNVLKARRKKVKLAVRYLLKNPQESPDVIFDLFDVLMFNGYWADVWAMLKVYYPLFKKSKKIVPGWEMKEIYPLVNILIHNECVDWEERRIKPDRGKEVISEFDVTPRKDFDASVEKKMRMILDQEYNYKSWSIDDFRGPRSDENLSALKDEFTKQLMHVFGLDFVNASYINEAAQDFIRNSDGEPFKFEKVTALGYLQKYSTIFNIRASRALIMLYSALLFYDFLHARGIYTDKDYKEVMGDLAYFRYAIYEGNQEERWRYKFVEELIDSYPRFQVFLEKQRQINEREREAFRRKRIKLPLPSRT